MFILLIVFKIVPAKVQLFANILLTPHKKTVTTKISVDEKTVSGCDSDRLPGRRDAMHRVSTQCTGEKKKRGRLKRSLCLLGILTFVRMTAVNVTVVSIIAGLTRNLCREKEAFWTPSPLLHAPKHSLYVTKLSLHVAKLSLHASKHSRCTGKYPLQPSK
jgi:hypothetical protein